jgi:diketogulonate reductase-like aldo/keto reductase
MLHEVRVPVLGLGVYQSPAGRATRNAVACALEAGYRHIDTAALYDNEADVGRAIRESGIPRSEIHVTTKLWCDARSADDVRRKFETSRGKLALDQVDLYLVHAPVGAAARRAVWHGMEQLLRAGDVRAIGVSNFGVQHLEELFRHAEIRPAMNQLELSPFLQRRELVAFCRRHGIALTAYSPLTKGRRLDDGRLRAIAERHRKSPAQVLIRWGLEQGFAVIPKSVRRERILENLAVFDFALSATDLGQLSGCEEGLITGWDPVSEP